MRIRKILIALVGGVVLAAVAGIGVRTRDTWRHWLAPGAPATPSLENNDRSLEAQDRVRLSPQARRNLRLVVQPVSLGSSWRTVQMPGVLIEQAGKSDRGVTAPLAAVVTIVDVAPGDTVRPGDALCTLRPLSEDLQKNQTELYKTAQELRINQEMKDRLTEGYKNGAIPERHMVELDYQQRRFKATEQALRHDLVARGLTPAQVQQAAEGKFVTEITIKVPEKPPNGKPLANWPNQEPSRVEANRQPLLHVEELQVKLGEQVRVGQMLCYLHNHQSLYVKGWGFKQEVPLLARAAELGWPVRAELAQEDDTWSRFTDELHIGFLSNTVDEGSQTLPFYVPLSNEWREYARAGKTYRIWRFRPGQRVRLRIPVEQFHDVFVLPADAVVREGPEAYVFRQDGDELCRLPVHILYEDDSQAAIANDGNISAGDSIAHGGAAALNRVLKAKAGDEEVHGLDR